MERDQIHPEVLEMSVYQVEDRNRKMEDNLPGVSLLHFGHLVMLRCILYIVEVSASTGKSVKSDVIPNTITGARTLRRTNSL